VTDDRGIVVTFAQAARSASSVLPSLTETVCELDQCQRLVGVDRYSNYPDQCARLPKVGGGLDPNIEAMVALKPDVVLDGHVVALASVWSRWASRWWRWNPRACRRARRVLEIVGKLLDVDDAQRVWRVIDAGVSAAAQSLPPERATPRVFRGQQWPLCRWRGRLSLARR
jgi:iron complex transport system substrate-binding protein